jgi:DNA-directed RNA polymerase specialized sigma24 family protein
MITSRGRRRSCRKRKRKATTDLAPSIQAMLACLPHKYCQALILADYQGLKQREVEIEKGYNKQR